jgi:hypothetical protein
MKGVFRILCGVNKTNLFKCPAAFINVVSLTARHMHFDA